MLARLTIHAALVFALMLGGGALGAEPTPERCGDLNAQAAVMSAVEWKRLRTDCFLAGLPTKLPTSDMGEAIPVDVPKVDLIVEVGGEFRFGLHSLPGVSVHPVVRDLYCREFTEDWEKLNITCPLPSMFSVAAVDPIGLWAWGPSLLLERGLPYDVLLRGQADRFEQSGSKSILYLKFLTFEDFTADYLALDHAVIRGDLIFKDSSIGSLFIDGIIVTGHIVFENVTIDRYFRFEDTLVHGGVSVNGLIYSGEMICENKEELATTPLSIDGPYFVQPCLAEPLSGR